MTEDRGHYKLVFGFVECDACRTRHMLAPAHGGDQEYCRGCLHNLARAREVRKNIDDLQTKAAAFNALLAQYGAMIRERDGEKLKRHAADAAYAVSKHEMVEMQQYATQLEDHITEQDLTIGELRNSRVERESVELLIREVRRCLAGSLPSRDLVAAVEVIERELNDANDAPTPDADDGC